MKVATAMAEAPDQSLPGQHGQWADLKAAYGFLNHPQVTPDEIQHTHRQQVREACGSHPLILAVEDTTELDFTAHLTVTELGPLSTGHRGLLQHSTLAVTPDGKLIGLLHQICQARVPAPKGETRKQRRQRPKESDFWPNSAKAVGSLGSTTRVIHVTDRGGDSFEMMQACYQAGSGFLIRAQHDRYVNDRDERLWSYMQRQVVAGIRDVAVAAHSARPAGIMEPARPAQPARVARLEVRYAAIQVPPPQNDPRFTAPLPAWAVYAVEVDPPANVEPIEWMLLTSEPVEQCSAAETCIDWYTHRWIIEEWHKVEKSGCRLEACQLKSAEGIRCLAAFTAVVAVRLIQLRDLAQAATTVSASAATTVPASVATTVPALDEPPPSRQPSALRALVPPSWIAVVSHLAGRQPQDLTPELFWRTLAKRGGFIGRKSDGQPGWQTIWRGWYAVLIMVQGFEMGHDLRSRETYG